MQRQAHRGEAVRLERPDPLLVFQNALAERIGQTRFQLWFLGHTRFQSAEGEVVILVPNRHYEEWLHRTFGEAIQHSCRDAFGPGGQARILVRSAPAGAEAAPASGHERAPAAEAALPVQQASAPAVRAARPAAEPAVPRGEEAERPQQLERMRRWRRLSDFVVGPCNRVAHAASLSVVEEPGECANPLVLQGPVGTGKTHLLEGIYTGLRRGRPGWKVCFITSEELTNRFVQAMRFEKLASFRRAFRECDALLVDDLQFLARKKATQEEILHTLDALLAAGRQVVVTCDCHPRLIEGFTPELTDRLLGGVIWGLTPPGLETRLDILRGRATQVTPAVPEAVLRFLAEQLRGNVRELEGALNSIRHYSKVLRRRIDLPLVKEALADLLRHVVRTVSLDEVDRAVCAVLSLPAGTLQAGGRAWTVSHPRMVAMYLARKHTGASYAEIGKHFGGRSHSTVVAAEKRVRTWLDGGDTLVLGKQRLHVRDLLEQVEHALLR